MGGTIGARLRGGADSLDAPRGPAIKYGDATPASQGVTRRNWNGVPICVSNGHTPEPVALLRDFGKFSLFGQ
jgi:hypothetical protein